MTDVLCVLTHSPPALGWGGAVRSAAATARIMSDAGFETRILASDGNGAGRPALSQGEAELVNGVACTLFHTPFAKRFGFGLGALPALWGEARRARCLYVSGVFTWPTTIAGWLARLMEKPYAVCPHGGLLLEHLEELRSRKPLKYAYYQLLVRPIIEGASLVRVSSVFEQRDLLAAFPGAPTIVIPNAFNVSAIPYAEEREATLGRAFVYVGRLEQDKGILRFTRLWLDVAGPEDQLRIIGSGTGNYADALRASGATDHRVQFLGELDREGVYTAIAASDILCLPSGLDGTLRENFGNVVVEALGVGRPVLVSKGLAWDHINEGRLGILFDEDDASVRSAISRGSTEDWIVDPETRRRCRQYAEENFDSAAVGARVAAMVRAIGRGGAR